MEKGCVRMGEGTGSSASSGGARNESSIKNC